MTARDEMSKVQPDVCLYDGKPCFVASRMDAHFRCGTSACDRSKGPLKPARDEGAGTMGRGEEETEGPQLSARGRQELDALTQAAASAPDLRSVLVGADLPTYDTQHFRANLANLEPPFVVTLYGKPRFLVSAPVSAPVMDREAVITIISDAMDSAIPEPWEVASLAADRILALAKGQKATAPADGSQVEPSSTGAGRHIPLEPPPFIQWNGGENPAPGKVVEFRLRLGTTARRRSNELSWAHHGMMNDIIAYRIIPTDSGKDPS